MILIREALRIKPNLWKAYKPLSYFYELQGNFEAAEAIAKEFVKNAPEDFQSHFTLGFFYYNTRQPDLSIASFEHAAILRPNELYNLWNLVISCSAANQDEKRAFWAGDAIPRYERHLKMFPDDENKRVQYAFLLFDAGRVNEAREAAQQLENIKDGNSLINVAFLECSLLNHKVGLRTLVKAIEAGYRDFRILNEILNDEKEGIGSLKGTPEYEEVKQMVEKIEAELAAAANTEAAKENG